MKTLRQSVLIGLLVGCMLFLPACQDAYGASAKAGADIAQSITGGFNTVTQLQQQGLISKAEALNVAGYLEFANKADEAFLSCIAAAHNSGSKTGSFTACASAFNVQLNNPQELALLHISNAQASQNISIVVNGVTTAVTAIITGLKGA